MVQRAGITVMATTALVSLGAASLPKIDPQPGLLDRSGARAPVVNPDLTNLTAEVERIERRGVVAHQQADKLRELERALNQLGSEPKALQLVTRLTAAVGGISLPALAEDLQKLIAASPAETSDSVKTFGENLLKQEPGCHGLVASVAELYRERAGRGLLATLAERSDLDAAVMERLFSVIGSAAGGDCASNVAQMYEDKNNGVDTAALRVAIESRLTQFRRTPVDVAIYYWPMLEVLEAKLVAAEKATGQKIQGELVNSPYGKAFPRASTVLKAIGFPLPEEAGAKIAP